MTFMDRLHRHLTAWGIGLLLVGCAAAPAPALPVQRPGPASAAPLKPTPVAARPPAVAPRVSLLDGMLVFTLPQGFATLPAVSPPGGKTLDPRVKRLSFIDSAKGQTVAAIESPTPNGLNTSSTDNHYLDGMVSRFVMQQASSVPGYQSLAIKRLTVNGLAIRQIESVENHGDTRLWTSTLLANAGSLFALVAVTTAVDDKPGHTALVQQVLSGK
jgi:hypothetical protein